MALILAAGATGCQARDIVPGVDDSTFVRTMVDLRRVGTDSLLGDSARAFRRDSVLKSHGVTVALLDSAARTLADDPQRAEALFRALNQAYGTPDTAARARRAGRRRPPT